MSLFNQLNISQHHAETLGNWAKNLEYGIYDKLFILKAAIDRLDREIDQMVYTLYGLTPDEIAIVEGA